MVQNNNCIVDDITQMSSKKRKTLMNWFSRQNFELQCIVFENQRNEYFKVFNLYKDLSKNIVSLVSFFLALQKLYDEQRSLLKKNFSLDLEKLEKISKIDLLSMKKVQKKEKYDFLLDRISKIEELYLTGQSTRNIAEYIRKVYRKNISHQYIHTFIRNNISKKDKND